VTDLEPVVDTKLSPRRPAPPPTAAPACLVFIHPTGPLLGCRHVLAARPVHIGRTDDCEVRLDDQFVSRRHARLDPADGGHLVHDLGSTNGTRVNDDPVTAGAPLPLRDGDYLRVGNCLYRYLAGGNVEAEYHEELYQLAIRDPLTRCRTAARSTSSWPASWSWPAGTAARCRSCCSTWTGSRR
jgi:hypothetical protein